MSIPARIIAIADIFEALTAADRPYKTPKRLSEALHIMSLMRDDEHIDADLFDLFLTRGVFQTYAEKHLDECQIDAVEVRRYLKKRVDGSGLEGVENNSAHGNCRMSSSSRCPDQT